eukprot:scaffold359879_cov17-Prasinocladus_malaysianus.AAC.1
MEAGHILRDQKARIVEVWDPIIIELIWSFLEQSYHPSGVVPLSRAIDGSDIAALEQKNIANLLDIQPIFH